MFHNLSWDFADKRLKPSQPVVIDWANSITRGLVAAHMPIDGGYIDLVAQDFNADTDGTILGSPSGLGLFYTDNVPTGRINYALDTLGTSIDDVTVMTSVFITGLSTEDHGLFTLADNSGNFGLLFWADTLSSQLRPGLGARHINGVNDIQYGAAGSIPTNNIANIAASRASGGEFRFCVNGENYATSAANTGVVDTDPYNRVRIAQRNSTSTGALEGGMLVSFFWRRQLSEAELIKITQDPYSFLKPAADQWAFIPKVTAGATYTLTPETGTFSVTGGALSLLHNKSLSPGTGSLTTTGGNVSLLYNRVITPETGSLSVTGDSINVLYNRQLTLGTGSFSLTGDPITLTYTPSGATYTLTPETGLFAVTGGALSLLHNKNLIPATGTLSVTGDSVSLLYNRVLVPSTGSFTLSGSAINLYANRQITLGTGALNVTGSSITLTYSSAVVPDPPESRTLSINAYARTLNSNTRIRIVVADEQNRNL